MSKIDHDLLKPMTDIFQWLGGAAPRKARHEIESVFNKAIRDGKDWVTIARTVYPTQMFEELNVCNVFGGNPRVTPAGARFLLDLYNKGVLPMNQRKAKTRDYIDPAIHDYIRSEPELLAKSEASAERARLVDAQYQAMLDDPAEIPEAKFSYALLNDIFSKRMGTGSGSITIGGFQVIKTVDPCRSNSEKSDDRAIQFSWRSLDGERKCIAKRRVRI
jgi:hypothetical protein